MDETLFVSLSISMPRSAISNTDSAGSSLKHNILLLAKYCGLFGLARILTARKTRILAYHGIWLGDDHFGNFLYMSAGKFARRMALLDKWGYPIVPLSESPSEDRCSTVITIDDGWYGTWSEMLPILEKYRFPATVYLTTHYCVAQEPVIDVSLSYCFECADTAKTSTLHLPGFHYGPVSIDSKAARKKALASALDISASLNGETERQQFLKAVCEGVGIDHARLIKGRWFHLMSPEEVKDAARRGISFESHTHHHRISHQGKDCLAEEIITNCEYIQALTKQVPKHFCYPSGRYTSALWPVLEKCHIKSATTTDIGLVDAKTPAYAMPRILDGEDVSELEFEAEMSGFMELSRALRNIGKRS